MDLKGQHILVTGASQGIGRAIAREIMVQGGRVAVHYNSNEGAARELLAEFPGTESFALRADLEKPSTNWLNVGIILSSGFSLCRTLAPHI